MKFTAGSISSSGVLELACYKKADVPRELAIQIVSYLRMQWPELLGQRTGLWQSTPYPPEGMHFVLRDADLLIGHALAHRKRLEHAGQAWEVGALSSVFVYPAHRGGGCGERIVSAATHWLRESGIDFALLFCGQRVRSLYLRCGWEEFPALRIAYGEPADPLLFHQTNPQGRTMTLRASERAIAHWNEIESQPIYIGPRTW